MPEIFFKEIGKANDSFLVYLSQSPLSLKASLFVQEHTNDGFRRNYFLLEGEIRAEDINKDELPTKPFMEGPSDFMKTFFLAMADLAVNTDSIPPSLKAKMEESKESGKLMQALLVSKDTFGQAMQAQLSEVNLMLRNTLQLIGNHSSGFPNAMPASIIPFLPTSSFMFHGPSGASLYYQDGYWFLNGICQY